MKELKWSELTDLQREIVLKHYQHMTGPEVCEMFNLEYNSVRSSLHRYHPKDMGKGGARPGSGNKKGRFCGRCRSLREHCLCPKMD